MGTQTQAIEYCKKDGDYTEHGEPRQQGKRVDYEAYIAAIKEGMSDTQLADNHPGLFLRYPNATEKLRTAFLEEKGKAELKASLENTELKPWQKDVVDKLDAQDNRKILWVKDTVGNKGKTFLTTWLEANRQAAVFENAKRKDIAYAWNLQKVIAFDYARTAEEYINYGVVESLKNGRLFSPKYGSCTKRATDVKIVCFANWLPDMYAWSQDRYQIVDLDEPMHP